ncbi:DUF2254 domain-containing protein [Streptomyces spinosus]|uniref:DUF2254 domain-containing protein n=1 Tax=Streptomyces spinosus TaxID=2872623 RepID=UPI001CEC3C32|nr:DUF2254 domain-containing protein [Streptomyces spinosus]
MRRTYEGLRSRLWPLPALGVALAVAAGVGLPELDRSLGYSVPPRVTGLLFGGGAEAARTVLQTIAGSLITVTALTFSLTVVALQMASSQYSPRLLRTFSADPYVQVTLALLLTAFTYALTVLRTVRTGDASGTEFVPQMSVSVAFVLALASVMCLVVFLSHLVRELRAEIMLIAVHKDAERTVDRVLGDEGAERDQPASSPRPPGEALPLLAARSGFLAAVDEDALLRAAMDADAVVLVDRLPGSSLVAGTPCGSAWSRERAPLCPDTRDRLLRRAAEAIVTGHERTDEQDVAFALRQFTDVALKALSPGVNDPTTAVHALSHSSALLCELARHRLGPRALYDGDRRLRVLLNRPDLPDLLDLAVGQPLRYGAGEPEVLARLLALLHEVAWVVRPDCPAALATYLRRLRVTVAEQSFPAEEQARLDRLAWRAEQSMSP